MTDHFHMIDSVNDAETTWEHEEAELRLAGWRMCAEYLGVPPSLVMADRYTIAKHGSDRPMCGGVLLDWTPKDQS